MVLLRGKTPKQYHRDNNEKNKEKYKAERKERYIIEKKNKITVIKVNNLTIHAKNVTIIDE